MSRRFYVVALFPLQLIFNLGSGAYAAQVTKEDYARAERFLSWNARSSVLNGDVEYHWIGRTDRFWYERAGAGDNGQRVVIDAATGKSSNIGVSVEKRPSHESPAEVESPDGKWRVFLKDYNIWLRSTTDDVEVPLTRDGSPDYGYANRPEFSTHSVTDLRQHAPQVPQVIWSPNSRYLFTYRLDERAVKESYLIQSVPEDGSVRPKLYAFRYAMPGDSALPKIELMVFDIKSLRSLRLKSSPLPCQVFTPIEKHEGWWSQDSRTIYYLSRDRFSKSVALNRVDPETGETREVIRERSDTLMYTNADNVFDYPLVRTLGNGDVIWYSQRSGWGHLYYYSGFTGALHNAITHGIWAVRGIVHVDEIHRELYFTASGREPREDVYQQHLYSIHFDGSHLKLLTPENADHNVRVPSLFSTIKPLDSDQATEMSSFSPSGRFFIDSYSRPDLPPVTVLRSADGHLIKRLEQADVSRLTKVGYTPIEPFQVIAADHQTPIYGNLFRPSNFDLSKKYPVIDAIYPGPQTIRTRKNFLAATFDEYEAQSLAELGFIVITIDGRGTPNRSKAFLDYSYGQLERASDLEDHIEGIRELARRYPYMDVDRVGVDGVSGGGYAAARAILAHPEFYKVAVAAEGNHDARGYVASWGDAYEGAATQENYTDSSNQPLAAALKGHLFLMYGDMDDNVSPSLTLKLSDALIKANREFDLLVIPNGNHLAWKSPYFIRRKWDYFVRYLLEGIPPPDYTIRAPQ